MGNNDKSHKNRLALLSSKEKTVKKMADSGEDSKQYYRSLFLDLLPDVVKVHLESRSVKSNSSTGTDNPKSSKRQWFGPGPSVAPAVLQDLTNVQLNRRFQRGLEVHSEFEGSRKGITDRMLSQDRKKKDWRDVTDSMLTVAAEDRFDLERSLGQDSTGEQKVLLFSIDFI